jgi:hypothetical protein
MSAETHFQIATGEQGCFLPALRDIFRDFADTHQSVVIDLHGLLRMAMAQARMASTAE